MTPQGNYFKLGLFIILSFLLGAAFLTALGAGSFFEKKVLVETFFNESVQGLNEGSPVKFKGITIGSVKSITSAAGTYQEQTRYIHVVMTLADEVFLGQTGPDTTHRIQKAIENGLTVHLSFMGLTGAAFLEMDYSTGRSQDILEIDWKTNHTYIPSRASSMKRFSETLNHIMDSLDGLNVKGMIDDLQSLLSSLNTKVDQVNTREISFQFESLAREIRETNQALQKWLDSKGLSDLISNADSSVDRLDQLLEKSEGPIANTLKNFEQTAENTRRLTKTFETKAMAEMAAISADISELTESLQRTATIVENTALLNTQTVNATMENLKITSENLKYLSMELKKYPGRIFETPPASP